MLWSLGKIHTEFQTSVLLNEIVGTDGKKFLPTILEDTVGVVFEIKCFSSTVSY
jgi:hypothetical protein